MSGPRLRLGVYEAGGRRRKVIWGEGGRVEYLLWSPTRQDWDREHPKKASLEVFRRYFMGEAAGGAGGVG